MRSRSSTPKALALTGALLVAAGLPAPNTTSAQDGVMAGDPRRITHQFDFDERDDGNLEDVPKYWVPLRPGGFPSFTRGRFDLEVGHLAPPSFYLDCDGRNVAYQYAGPETRVRANTDYRIEAYLKPDQLYHARACLSAHFLDERGNPVEGTLVRSRYVGGPEDNDQWIRIELFLHNAPQRAQTIGLIGWVLQREMWDMSKPPKRHIPRKDVRAGMWLDDITIYALPRVELKTSAPGNVLGPDDINEIHVVLADNEDRNLWGKLTVATAAGQTIRTHHVRAVLNEASAIERINVADLPPGMYQARLEVQSGETIVGVRTLDFARLGDLHRSAKAPARSFGISIDPRWRQESKVELALLNHQAIRSVKLPVWTGLPGTGASVAEMRDVDRLIQGLIKRNFAITGVFHGPPSEIVRSDGPYARSLMALLADDPSVWQEYLASVVAPYATVFRWWQLGGDGGEGVVAGPELTTATSQFREAMRRFITTPSISLPVSAAIAPGDNRLPAEHITVTLDARLDPDYFAHDIKTFTKLGFDHVAVHVPPLPTSKYQPAQRVADWARRLIVARHGGARTAYAPQTWRVRETWYGRIAEPKEEYLVLRTIADVVGDALPMGAVQAPPGVKCLMFVDGDSVVMAAWDTLAPPAGSRYTLQLGQAARMIDLAGRSFPLDRDEHNRQIVYLSATPILIDNIDRWIVEFRNSLAIEPSHVESGLEIAKHTLTLTNSAKRPISGSVTLTAPEGAEIKPHVFTLNLLPMRSAQLAFEARYAHNEPAGTKQILVGIRLFDPTYYFEIPVNVDIWLTDVDVSGTATIEGDALVLRHVVTNLSDQVLHFRSTANVPGRERQYRPVTGLVPNGRQVVEYRFPAAANLGGKAVRLVLRELNDGPRIHNLELTVP